MTQNAGVAVSNEVHHQVRNAVLAMQRAAEASQAPAKAGVPNSPAAPVALPPHSVGGGRLIIDQQGDRTVVTSAALPPEVLPLARMAQETSLGLVGLLAAIIILGPFARLFARRMERRPELKAAEGSAQVLQQQLVQLQQSVDAMSLEVERISESQRFQSKLLYERKS
jgi:hypothetical protein